jgi:hypothetical protein
VCLRCALALIGASSSRSQRARSPTTTLTLSDLPWTVRRRPLASAGVCGGCYSVSYLPAKGRGIGRLDLMTVRFSGVADAQLRLDAQE